MPTLLFHVDAFTRTPFRGNPAVVVILDGPRDEGWMQAVAREMKVSETAFATLLPSGAFALRWFTPVTEMPLCGHATLATAAVLLSQGVVAGEVAFDTLSGRLTVTAEGNGYRLDLPALATEPAEAPEIVAAAGVQALEVRVSREGRKWLVRVATAAEVRGLAPDLPRLLGAPNPLGLRGLVVTAPGSGDPSESGAHFVSRYFAPWVGVAEDPVTGSAHALLGPYWADRLGRTRLLAAQLSERGGEVGVEVRGDRVQLTGSCVVLSRGFWLGLARPGTWAASPVEGTRGGAKNRGPHGYFSRAVDLVDRSRAVSPPPSSEPATDDVPLPGRGPDLSGEERHDEP